MQRIPVASKNKREQYVERSLFEDLPELESFDEKVQSRYGKIAPDYKAETVKVEEDKEEKSPLIYEVDTFKTALCVEERDGIIYGNL